MLFTISTLNNYFLFYLFLRKLSILNNQKNNHAGLFWERYDNCYNIGASGQGTLESKPGQRSS